MKRVTLAWMLLGIAVLFAGKAPFYELGDAVTDFTLMNVDGKMISLSDYKDKQGLIVIFDCNTCPFSKAYNDRIIGLNKTYAPKGFPVVTINANSPDKSPGDSFDKMVSLAKKKNYDFPYLVDERQDVARSFGASNTPHVFVLKNETENFKVAYIGTIDNNSQDASKATKRYVEDAVDALIANKPVPLSKTKAVGCGIKWKS